MVAGGATFFIVVWQGTYHSTVRVEDYQGVLNS